MSGHPPASEPAAPRRTAGAWALVLAAWGVGLVVWAIYLAMITWGLYRVLR